MEDERGDVSAATDIAYDSQAVAGVIGDLCHVLGLDQNKVARFSIQPGYVSAEILLDETEPVPGTLGMRRKAIQQGFSYPLPPDHSLRYVEEN